MLSMISLMHTGMSIFIPFLSFFGILMSRIEHAYRQSAPDNYGTGLGMMGGNMGGMGINNLPGSQMMLMGRGGFPVG
jgi:hypothetical protein